MGGLNLLAALTALRFLPEVSLRKAGEDSPRLSFKEIGTMGSTLLALLIAIIPLTNNFGQLLVVLLIQGLGGALSMPAAQALTMGEGRKFGMGSTMSILFLAMGIGMAA